MLGIWSLCLKPYFKAGRGWGGKEVPEGGQAAKQPPNREFRTIRSLGAINADFSNASLIR